MLRKGIYIACLFWLVSVTSALAQREFQFKHLDVNDGLSQSSVLEIFRDHLGYVWFGTRTGLDRFDGLSMENYLQNPDDSLSINYGFIVSIVEDQEGDLWIGSKGGLYHYDRSLEKFSRYLHDPDNQESLGSNMIVDLEIDEKNRLWICHTKGLDLYTIGEVAFVHAFDILDPNFKIEREQFFGVEEDDIGRIWVASATEIFQILWDRKQIKKYEIPFVYNNLEKINEETSLLFGKSGKLWVAGLNGQVFSYSSDQDRLLLEHPEVLPECFINCIEEDLDGNLLIGTVNGGLFVFNIRTGLTSQYIHEPFDQQSLSNEDVYSIFTDEDGTTWIGNWEGGINYSNKYHKPFEWVTKNIVETNGLVNENVIVFHEDINQDIWIGTWAGLSKWDRKNNIFTNVFSQGSNKDFFKGNSIQCFLEQSPGKLWVGTSNPGGLYEVNSESLMVKPISFSWDDKGLLENIKIISIENDLDGLLWFGTRGGIYRVDTAKQTIRSYNSANSALRTNGITCSFLDKNGVLWFGSSAGLYRYDKENDAFIQNTSFFSGILSSPKWVSSIFEDHIGQFWIGTAGYGLVLYDRETGNWERFTTKNGLSSNVIRGIVQDDHNKLWISSYKGITRFNSVEKTVVNNYDSNDGLRHIEFGADCSLKTHDNEILFGGGKGFAIFKPNEFLTNIRIPNIVFKDLKIGNKLILPETENSPLKESISQTSLISLNHKQKSFSVSFVSLDLVDASKNKYLCFLEGYDKDWYSPSSKGIVNFDNLKPGKYTFHVKGSNNDGVWNEVGISMQIRIHPPWYFSIFAYGVYVLIFLGLLLLYSRLVRFREKDKQIALGERMEKEKIQELNKARLQFFTEIAHDFKTPLSLILSPAEQLKSYHSSDKKFEKLIGLVSRNAKRLEYLIGELMTFRKLEMSEVKLDKRERDIIPFIKGIVTEFMPLMARQNIHLNFRFDSSQTFIPFDKEKMERVFYNLLDNAIKYTPRNGLIKVIIESHPIASDSSPSIVDDKEVVIRIFNSGQPFSKEDLQRIFDRFYQGSDRKKVHSGYGIGLVLVKGLIELHQGSIEVRNIPKEGKEFVVRLPKTAENEKFEVVHHSENVSDDDPQPKGLSLSSEAISTTTENQIVTSLGEQYLILIVEDNDEFRDYLESMLKENFKIISGADGSQGFELAIDEMPDLIISDVMMPKMDGLEFCELLKKDLRTCHIPIILLTAKAEIEHRLQGLETGADAYITKPFIFRHLEIQIRNLINTRDLLARKFSSKESFVPEEVYTSKMDQEFLNKAIQYVHENIAEDNLNINLLSEHMCVSRRHLYRKVKVLTGSSPVEFIQVIRLRRAMELLTDNSHSISEIGYQVGFNNPSYFARSFKKMYGHPPSFFVK